VPHSEFVHLEFSEKRNVMINFVRTKYKVIGSGALLLVVLLALFSVNRLFATGQERESDPPSKTVCAERIAMPQATPRANGSKSYLPLVTGCFGVTPTATPNPWTDPAEAIEVFSPVKDGGYHSPIEIIGYSQTFEGNVILRLLNSDATPIAERFTMGGSVDGYDFFHSRLRFYVDAEEAGTVEVYEESAEDGSQINKVTIPVVLMPGQRVIDVDSPKPGAALCSPVISGYSNTFEANVVITLSDRNGTPVATPQPTMGGNLGFYRPFSASVPYTVTAPTALLIGAHETSPKDGSNVDYTRIPFSLYPCP
jgi:hypothetical protein